MARTKRSAKLDTWNARRKLKAAQMHQERINTGQYIAYRRPKSGGAGTWFARWWKDDGKIEQARLGTADDIQDADGNEILAYPQAQASALLWFKSKQRQAALEADGEALPKGSFKVSHALDAYFKDAQRRGVKGVAQDINRANSRIIPILGSIEVSRLTRVRIENWLDALANSPRMVKPKIGHEPKYAPPPKTEDEKRARKDTANRVFAVLRAALSFSVDRRLVDVAEQPWRLVKLYRGVKKARTRFLTHDEQVRLVNACHPQFKPLLRGALLTGCRYGELTRLKCKDYSPENGTIFVSESKTGKPRHVYLTEEGKTLFDGLTDRQSQESAIFTLTKPRTGQISPWQRNDQGRFLKEAYTKAGIETVTFHELRHTYASTLVNRGCSLYVVAQQLGHSGTNMVEKHYGHLAPNTVRDEVLRAMPTLGIMDAPKAKEKKPKSAKR